MNEPASPTHQLPAPPIRGLGAQPFVGDRRPGTPLPRGRRTTVGAAVAAAILLAVLIDLLTASGAAPKPTPTPAAGSGQPSISEGPGGRVALTSWRVARDPGNRGLSLGWSRGTFSGNLVRGPHVVNAQPITGTAGVKSYAGSVAWYRTSFSTPQDASYALLFQSVNHRATVWLDGRNLGTHVGTYLPFEFRFHLAPGAHTLVVRADWRDPAAMSRQGFHRTWFNFGGINREVTIRPLGESGLDAPTIHTFLQRGGGSPKAIVDVGVEVHNYGPARQLTPGGTLKHGDTTIPLHFDGLTITHGGAVLAHARAVINDPALWAPGSPNLYDLNLSIGEESTYYAPVGLRELHWSGGALYLNGKRTTLHGASIQEDVLGHGDALTPNDQNGLISDLRAIGANATRSQHPLDLGLLERLDAAGIMLWQGIGPVDSPGDWSSRTPGLMAAAKRRVRISVRQAQAHPAVIAWNLANEVGGNGHAGGQVEYVDQMARALHMRDPGRMVAVDVWGEHPPSAPGPLYRNVDAIGETNYAGWYDGALSPDAIGTTISNRLAAMHRAFPNKVIIISEFGAEANYLNHPETSPGGYQYQAALLAEHIRLYARDPQLTGMLIWNLRDFAVAPTFAGGSIKRRVPGIHIVKGLNQKGIFGYRRQPKPAVGVVRSLYRQLGGSGA